MFENLAPEVWLCVSFQQVFFIIKFFGWQDYRMCTKHIILSYSNTFYDKSI